MVLINCHTEKREFWGVFEDSEKALRVLFAALETAFPNGAPNRLSISYCPIAQASGEVGTLFEGPTK